MLLAAFATAHVCGQNLSASQIPVAVKSYFLAKYPNTKNISWEKEKGSFEANWGGQSGEDTSVKFTPAGKFVELVASIPVTQLPGAVALYVKAHYKNAPVKEAGKVTDATGKAYYEAEIKGKDLFFDENGNFIKED